MRIYEDIALVKCLQSGEHCHIAWSEEMGGIVYRNGDSYTLNEVTGYGSYESEYGNYTCLQIEEFVSVAHTWT